MKEKFTVIFLDEVREFLLSLDKEDAEETLVISTHGVVKKSSKVNKIEIDKAETIRIQYFKTKKKENEKV